MSGYTCPPTLAGLPGFHRDVIKFDWMHTCHLGVMQWSVGNCLLALFEAGAFPRFVGAFQMRFGLALRHAWTLFKSWGREAGVDTGSQPCFTPAMLGLSSQQQWPQFKGKASNTGK
eukprot:10841317-Alexandrium_andersonii.AAC.1